MERLVREVRWRLLNQPSFPESPIGFSRYYSGWNLEGFKIGFDSDTRTFDKFKIDGAFKPGRTHFYVKDKPFYSEYAKGDPFRAANLWALDNYSNKHIPIVFSGVFEES